jgi:hypothetical protein
MRIFTWLKHRQYVNSVRKPLKKFRCFRCQETGRKTEVSNKLRWYTVGEEDEVRGKEKNKQKKEKEKGGTIK